MSRHKLIAIIHEIIFKQIQCLFRFIGSIVFRRHIIIFQGIRNEVDAQREFQATPNL